ncbi:hypothetical protein pb186bvf_003629 [Paramecium bursaria]
MSKQKKKPEWVNNFADQDKYKLTQSELMQKKISLISKHKIEAKDSWQNLQHKLKHHVVDEQTQKVYETALQSKGINPNKVNRKNLTQMIEWEKDRQMLQSSQITSPATTRDVLEEAKQLIQQNKTQDSEFLEKIKSDLDNTRQFLNKVNNQIIFKAQKSKKPEQVIKAFENSIKEIKDETKDSKENKEIKSNLSSNKQRKEPKNKHKSYDFNGFQNLDNVIQFLENTLQKPEEKTLQLDSEKAITIKSRAPTREQQQLNLSDIKFQEVVSEQQTPQIEQQYREGISKIEPPQKFDQTKLERSLFDQNTIINGKSGIEVRHNEISFDDNIDQLKQMLELTRNQLNQMNLHEPSFLDYDKSNVWTMDQPQQVKFDFKELNRKYRNTDTFSIKDYCK